MSPVRRQRATAHRLSMLVLLVLAVGRPAPAAAAGWSWPLPGTPTVLRGFQPPATSYAAGHRGVDLAAPAGTPVLAAGDGVVGFAGLLAGRGVVTVVHGALRTTYQPVTSTVRAGQQVATGALLGRLTAGVHCTSTCLHWGLLRGTTYLDPLSLLGAGPVRLLPMGPAPVGRLGPPTEAVGAAARDATARDRTARDGSAGDRRSAGPGVPARDRPGRRLPATPLAAAGLVGALAVSLAAARRRGQPAGDG